MEEACSVEPCDSCCAEADNSCEPVDTLLAAATASATTARSFSSICSRAWPIVSRSESGTAFTVRSPSAIAPARAAVALRLAVIRFMAAIRSPISSSARTLIVWSRSPTATASARDTDRARPRAIEMASQPAIPRPMRNAPATVPSRILCPSREAAFACSTAAARRLSS